MRFLCRLGQGGMAEVHLAASASAAGQPSLVVVKRMHQQHAEDAATVRMFLDEARLAMRLSHPNIVRTERVGTFDGRHGIVMEFLEGQPFQQVLKRAYEVEASLSLDIVVQVAMAALDGLHYAHELKDTTGAELRIVHRDVSPQNLFITYDGAVKLLDFGIAKNALQDGRTRTGLLKGKVSYMAPEQARGESIDRRADLWSLGVMLWEAVTGSRLFRGANEAATLHLTLTEEVAPPSRHRPDLPPDLEAILMRALKRNPDERYATAAAMRDDLEAWLSGREVSALSSISHLMRRLFGAQMQEQRDRVAQLLQEQPDLPVESGMTLVAPVLGPISGTVSGMRATQISNVTDLMEELTRQRRVTTRLLGGLVAIVAVAAIVGLYVLMLRPAVPIGNGAAAGSQLEPAPKVVNVRPPAPEAVTAAVPQLKATVAAVARPATPSPANARPPRASKAAQHARAGAPLVEPAAANEAAPAAPESGLLNLDSTPWSIVSVNGRVLGQTPLVGASLPAGVHTLVLNNPELGLKTTYQVAITAGRTTARRVGLDQ
jgi:serine/threonine protein kinase